MSFPAALKSRSGMVDLLEATRSRQPHLHQIEPTNHCPFSCVMCPRSEKMERPLGFMDIGLFRQVIDEVATYPAEVRAKEIELFHFGESLLHPGLPDMVRHVADRGLIGVLSVNPQYLTPDRVKALLDVGPAKIIISLDGWDDDSLRRIRGRVANYTKAVENIQQLLKARAAMNVRTEIVVRMIVLHANAHAAESFRDTWQTEGVTVEIRPFFPWTEKDLADLGSYERLPPNMPCPFPWRYLVVQWDGTVVPCCRDYNAVNAMGNVRDQSLEDIWNGPAYEAFRHQHATGEFGDNDFCRDCSALYCVESEAQESA